MIPSHANPPTLSAEDGPSRYGSINNFQPLLSNVQYGGTDVFYDNSDPNLNFANETDMFSCHQPELLNESDAAQDLISSRLDQLVSDANRFRTKACGMNLVMEREFNDRRKNNPKVPGSTVTMDDIDD